MSKVLISIGGFAALAVAGYFVDPHFKAQVNGIVAAKQSATVVDVSASTTTVANAPVKAGGRLDAILNSGTVTASVQSPSKPFFDGAGGHAKGFNVDFLKLLANQGDFKGKVGSFKFDAVDTYADVPKQLLSNKSADIAIDGLTFNDDDLSGVVYTIPYVKDFGYSFITLKGVSVASAADVQGMRIGVLAGDPDAKSFVEGAYPGAKIIELSDKADSTGKWIVGHFNAKTVDAVVYDYPFAVAEVDGTNLQFAMAKIKGSDIQYRIGVRKGDTDLLAALNSAIRKAMETDTYTEMLKTYFMSTSVAAVRRASSGEGSYIVVKGDTLSTIAMSQLGDIKRYVDIQTRNNLANPNFIAVGQKLVMPK